MNGSGVTSSREPLVRNAVSRLATAIEHADKASMSLTGRLETVLACAAPCGIDKLENAKTPEPVLPPLAVQLTGMAIQLERVVEFLAATERRVEL